MSLELATDACLVFSRGQRLCVLVKTETPKVGDILAFRDEYPDSTRAFEVKRVIRRYCFLAPNVGQPVGPKAIYVEPIEDTGGAEWPST